MVQADLADMYSTACLLFPLVFTNKIDHKEGRLPFDLITTPFTNNMDDVDQSNLTLHLERPYISGSYKEAQL